MSKGDAGGGNPLLWGNSDAAPPGGADSRGVRDPPAREAGLAARARSSRAPRIVIINR